jgi:Rrf2 family iron-sulfur cluster assembly transcriptional regulator
MVYLAQHEAEWPVSGPTIARNTGIPAKYLSAILGTLVRDGVLDAARGKRGGFRMNRAPSELRLLDIVAPFETRLTETDVPCPFGNNACNDKDPCGGHHRWAPVKDAFLHFLHETAIGEVAKKDCPTLDCKE